MKNTTLTFVISSVLCLCAFSNVAKAQILLNGSFETAPLPTNTLSATGAPTSWVVGGITNVSTYANSTTTGNGIGNTPYLNQFLVLSSGSSVSQLNISGFTAGETYVLGADFANVDSTANSSLTMSISGVAGTASATYGATSAGPFGTSTIPFQSGVLFFTATSSGTATISFSDLAGGGKIALDNVALYGFPPDVTIPNAVPEPTTCALLLGGLVGMVLWQSRRRRA